VNVDQLISKHLHFVTPFIHKIRRLSLYCTVQSVMNGADLSVTGLGRNIDNKALEKHRIKRVDRLCNNSYLHREIESIYQRMITMLIAQGSRPVILVDWSDMDNRKEHFLLRASLATQGRSLTLYEEIHPLSMKEKPQIHSKFMMQLKTMLPEHCQPIIVTDAGFRNPWFRLVESLGWDFVGRVRNRTYCKRKSSDTWHPSKSLYSKASRKSKDFGVFQLGMQNNNAFETRLIVFKRKPKGRKDKTALGDNSRQSKKSRACAEREREPWLLATSLTKTKDLSKKVVRIYATRMQIEESFRDLKTGLGMNAGDTRIIKRLNVLLIIACLAQYLLFLLGLTAKEAGVHRRYQANSVKRKNVLSNQFIGLRAYKDKHLKLLKQHWVAAQTTLQTLISEPKAHL
jgi:hypothetical protein